jgi:hypothetical protein
VEPGQVLQLISHSYSNLIPDWFFVLNLKIGGAMNEEGAKRKLSGTLSADVVGYNRLM